MKYLQYEVLLNIQDIYRQEWVAGSQGNYHVIISEYVDHILTDGSILCARTGFVSRVLPLVLPSRDPRILLSSRIYYLRG
jgi:hypothetical protein